MAFSEPKYWQKGDLTSATEFNKYSTNLSYLAGVFPGFNLTSSRKKSQDDVPAWFVIQHRFRYLVYKDAEDQCRITNRNQTETQGLSKVEDGDTYAVFDLDELDWLVSGMLYIAWDCEFAIETDWI